MAAQGATSSSRSEGSSASVSPPELPPTRSSTSVAVSKSPLESKASTPSPPPRGPGPENTLPAAVFYGPLDARNPLLASCERDIRELLGFVKKKASATTEEQRQEFRERCATTLFNIWTKYAPRLPADYYNEKLLKVGDGLCDMKEYKLALLQCYGRYLQQFGSHFDETKADVNQFKTVFFPKGFEDKTARLTFHALYGKNICNYQLVCDSDMNLQNKDSVSQCLHVLSSLRLIMQVALPQEQLCWIVFNGTIYIYTICRKLMVIGYSSKALEYLLWASVCMESSVPLLAARHLSWRVTLYAAVCQCYYDCQASVHGEAFARRALAKIDELRQLELMSSTQSQEESKRQYREAAIKMAVMIFKRGVFESRRKSKAYFRPKTRINLKEAQSLSWPRTATERLLDEMFDSTASKFLAVVEALSDSNRRTLQTGPLATDEVELRDVVSELFISGKELLIISNTGARGTLDFPKISLLELMIERKNIISMDVAVKFIKLAFTFEEWGLFESAAGQLSSFFQRRQDPEAKKAEKDLTLLLTMEPLINVKRSKGLIFPLENYKEGQAIQLYLKNIGFDGASVNVCGYAEDVFHLAAVLHFCICTSPQNVQPDKEIVEDTIMFLWQRCKLGIHRISLSRNDFTKCAHKISTNKWVYLLWQINEMIHGCEMEDVDLVVVAEVTLRLTEILEFFGSSRGKHKKSLDTPLRKGFEELPGTPKGILELLPILKKTSVEQLFFAYELLDKAIGRMNLNYVLTTLANGSSVIDHCYVKCSHDGDGDTYQPISENTFMMDLHLELIQAQHRIAVLLLGQLQVLQASSVSKTISAKSSEKLKQSGNTDCFTELSVMNKIKKNKLSKAIYLMQKALFVFENDPTSTCSQNFLTEAYSLIEKTEAEQSALFSYQKYLQSSKIKKSRVPPPPIFLARTHCSVTLKPAPFVSDAEVSWYCILGRKAEGSYGKVRLNNHHLPNSAEAIPADGKSIFEVRGLEANEKYVFAVAAYSSNGKLVGDAVGDTSKPILVYPSLSAVTARMHLTQVAYQIGHYELAKKVFSPVWDYFIASPSQDEQSCVCLSNIMMTTQTRLRSDILAEASSILLYVFLRNIFVTIDIKIKEENLFCDNIKGNQIFPAQQIARLKECERILVALELSNFLNDSSYALQAVTQCYGLLAPIIYHSIALVPVVQILIKCMVVLQGLPNIAYLKKHIGSFESVQHMIACCIFYLTKTLRSWKECDLAVMIINYGKKMLDITPACKSVFGKSDPEEMLDEFSSSKKILKNKKPPQTLSLEKMSEQLALLETHLLKMTKQYTVPELSGTEDPIFLYSVVLNWSVKGAVKEVMKFKQRPRFLEFFTHIMLKCINDEKFHILLEITTPVCDFLKRRNESLLGIKKIKMKDTLGKTSVPLKFKTSAVDFGASTETVSRRKSKRKETLKDLYTRNPSILELPEFERNKRSDVRKVAYQCLMERLSPLVLSYVRRKRFRQIFLEEMPWRAQMNLFLAVTHFYLFLQRFGERNKTKSGISHVAVSFRSCDPNLFSLYNSGTVLSTGKMTVENYKAVLDFPLTAKKRKANLPSDAAEFSEFASCRSKEENMSKAPKVHDSDSPKDRAPNLGQEHFMKIFLYCRRAMVLAHRGGYWTLLQNCCRAFWNFTQELQILLNQTVDLYKTFPVSHDGFLCISVLAFYLGADLLIDMLVQLQNTSSIQSVEDKGEFSVPSCYGNIKYDNGGSSLTFEDPLDDVNVVDLKWIHDFVLKSLEVLYQVEKWETLVSLAIQFNMISHERYTEQVTPLLVYAQRQLLLRIEKFKGPDVPQQACARFEAEHGMKITCRNFMGKQLKIDSPPPSTVMDARGPTDLLKMLVHSEYNRAKQLVCVPVDVTDTLRCFRETLEKSKYHNRSFRHSKKLLSLLLAQTQGEKGGVNSVKLSSGKVEFCLGIEEIHMSTPPDLSQEQFRVFSSVEKSKLPYSQLGLVISSYHQTIDVLQASNQRSLKVQALHALGSLLIFAGKKRAALKCWCQALDDIFRKPDVLHTWRELGASLPTATSQYSPVGFKDYSEEFLSKVGIWGCLQGAVISAKIAQFIKTVNIKKRINCCILSALLFQGLLRTTLPHPKAARCYAHYEVTQLLPGLELFSDILRADVCSVVSSLYYVIRELHFVKHNLIVLPLLALYQYFVFGICQDLVRSLEARILKVEVLIDLSLFSEAFFELYQISYGRNMPSSIPSCCKVLPKSKPPQSFDSGKPLTSRENMQALEEIATKTLPQFLVTVGQQHLLNKFCFMKAYFLISVAATINCVPDNSLKTLYSELAEKRSKLNVTNLIDLYLKDDRGSFCQFIKVKDESTFSMIKGVLLMEAEDQLNSLVSEVEQRTGLKDLSQCSAGELETVVEARLQLAAIALQWHRAAYSAAIVYSTLTLLQDSKLFKKTVVQEDAEKPRSSGTSVTESKDENVFLDPISLNAREYFNAHLWLRCRLALVTAFGAQIRGIGIVKENDMTDCLSLIKEVCAEATSADDTEMQAEFLMQAVILGLQEKHLKADIITNLQDIIHLLEGDEFISPRSWLTLARSLVLLDDLTKAEKFKQQPPFSKREILKFLTQAHNILIEQMLTFGETIEFPSSNTEYANPLQPLKNVWLPHVMLLAKIKMRIGHTLAKQAHWSSKRKDSAKWVPALHLFETALRLCKTAAVEECEVEAEILFQKGKIERQIVMEEKSPSMKFESLCEAIQLSLKNDQNSGLIRDSYLEMALFCLHGMIVKRRVSQMPPPVKLPVRRTSSVREPVINRFEMYNCMAWIAIRAAAQVSEAVLAVNLLIGKKDARTDRINQTVLPNVPEFAIVDLLSSYTDYLLDNYQVSFQTCYTFLCQNDDTPDGADATQNPPPTVDITWVLLLRYYIHLQRINNFSKLLASATPGSGISLPDDSLFTSLYNTELIVRQKEMHVFLKKFLLLYSSSCIGEFPRELLQGLETMADSEKVLNELSPKLNRDSSLQSVSSLRTFAYLSVADRMSTEMTMQVLDKELCFQWYMPPLDRPPEETEPMVLLLYAYSMKPTKATDIRNSTSNNVCVGSLWLPLKRVISIHEKLSNLAQIAEISLPSIPEIASCEDIRDREEVGVTVDTDMELMIVECCSEIRALFTRDKEPAQLTEVPFDISLPSIFNLERLFDLANGCVVSGGSLYNWMVSIIP